MATYFQNFPKLPYTFDPNYQNWFNVTNIFTKVSMLSSPLSNSFTYYQYDLKETDKFEHIAYKYYNNINDFWILLFANNIIDPFYGAPLDYQSFINYINLKYAPNGGYIEFLNNYTQEIFFLNNSDSLLNFYDNQDINPNDTPTNGIQVAQSTLDHYELQTTTIVTASNGYYYSNTTTAYFSNTTYAIYDIRDLSRDPTQLPTLEYDTITFVSPPTTVVSGGTAEYPDVNNQLTVNQVIKLVAVSCYDAENALNEDKRHIKIIKKDYASQIENELTKLLTS